MANTEAPGPTFKFLFIGDAGVGKSRSVFSVDTDFVKERSVRICL